jgi:ABC-type glycerol-3-phosphate transport system substrate-binding protein
MKMKALFRIVTLVMIISFLASLRHAHSSASQVATKAPAVVPRLRPLSAQEEWLKANELGKYETGNRIGQRLKPQPFAEGTVLVYANSSKVEKAAEAFMEKYPGIQVQAFDLGGDDVLLKTVEEQKAGAFTGDVWFSSGGAELVGTVLPKTMSGALFPTALRRLRPKNTPSRC